VFVFLNKAFFASRWSFFLNVSFLAWLKTSANSLKIFCSFTLVRSSALHCDVMKLFKKPKESNDNKIRLLLVPQRGNSQCYSSKNGKIEEK